MGRNKYSQHEIDIIGKLLRMKCKGTRFQQKQIRHQLRVNFEFNISDFGEQGKAFGYDELQAAIQRGAIRILDDATIADMKAKRQRDRQRDMAAAAAIAAEAQAQAAPMTEEEQAAAEAQAQAAPMTEEEQAAADWQKALDEWNEQHPDEKVIIVNSK